MRQGVPAHGVVVEARNVTVERFGTVTAGKAGIDVRGRVRLENIDVLEVGPGQAGIRFRDNDKNGKNGIGGLWSSVGNFFVTKTRRAGLGIQNPDARGVSIGSGTAVEPDGRNPQPGG